MKKCQSVHQTLTQVSVIIIRGLRGVGLERKVGKASKQTLSKFEPPKQSLQFAHATGEQSGE